MAVLLSVGLGTACKPPQPPEPEVIDTSEADRLRAEQEAREKAAREEAAAKAEADRIRQAEENARRDAERRAAEARRADAVAALVDVNFDYDKSEIRAIDRAKLQRIADFMLKYPDVRVEIGGHCDERGTIEYNLALGERRAFAAKAYLTTLGVSDYRLSTISHGKELPKVFGSNEISYSENRRCEFKLQDR